MLTTLLYKGNNKITDLRICYGTISDNDGDLDMIK